MRGMSAQQLSTACKELGHPIARSVIANLESGRRSNVSVAEMLILATALNVPPATLLFPVGFAASVEVVPGGFETPLRAVDWMSGNDRQSVESVNSLPIGKYRKLVRAISTAQAYLDHRARAVEDFEGAGGSAAHDRNVYVYDEAERRVEMLRQKMTDIELGDSGPSDDYGTLEAQHSDAVTRVIEADREMMSWRYIAHNLKEKETLVVEIVQSMRELIEDCHEIGLILPGIPDEVLSEIESPRPLTFGSNQED
jgi:transcriptional regulator with XRE-family HTH domain